MRRIRPGLNHVLGLWLVCAGCLDARPRPAAGECITEEADAGPADPADPPKLVLALDYSGSMTADFDGVQTRAEVVQATLLGLLDLGLPIQWGLVIYSSGVRETVAVASDNELALEEAMGRRGPGGATRTHLALESAGALLRATGPERRHLLLVSDGYPNGGDPVPVSDRLRLQDNVSILALEVRSVGALDGLQAVMTRMAGAGGDPDGDDPRFYASAGDPGALQAALDEVTNAVLCGPRPQ